MDQTLRRAWLAVRAWVVRGEAERKDAGMTPGVVKGSSAFARSVCAMAWSAESSAAMAWSASVVPAGTVARSAAATAESRKKKQTRWRVRSCNGLFHFHFSRL